MWKFISKSLFFIVPILILYCCIELVLRSIPNDYISKNQYLVKNAKTVNVLILGSSHSFYGLNPEYFDKTTFNLAHVSQKLLFDYELLLKYINDMDSLQTIILPISYHSMLSDYNKEVDRNRVKNYLIYYNIDTLSKFKHHFEILCNSPSKNLKRITDYALNNKTDISCSYLGWGTTYHSSKAHDLKETGKTACERHTHSDVHSRVNIDNYTNNLNALISIADLCQHKHISLLLITPPAYTTYRELLNPDQLNMLYEATNFVSSEYECCNYYDMINNPDFTAVDFYDADHLSEIGAKKLSLMLNEIVKQE